MEGEGGKWEVEWEGGKWGVEEESGKAEMDQEGGKWEVEEATQKDAIINDMSGSSGALFFALLFFFG